MALIYSNCSCISSSSTLLTPLFSQPNSYQNSVKLNRNSVGNNRSKSQGRIRARKSDSLLQLDNALSTSSNSALDQLDIERGVCVPFRKYTPELVRNKVLESRGTILSLIGRGVAIVWNLGLYWSALMYDCFVGRDEEVVPFRARQLRNLLCDLGPSFIKAGQVLANRPDIIREDYMNELCILQDDVPPFPNQVAFDIIEEELGQFLEDVSAKFHHRQLELQAWVKFIEQHSRPRAKMLPLRCRGLK